MKSNYRKIGEYIREVDKRNSDLKVTELRGLSMTKEFRESTSNIVGTDMTVYKVMHKWQFACDFMSPIRVSKLPVVLKMDEKPNLVSPAYPVFEVIDRNKLDPEYLMMWFRRPEFDRYATFKCDSAIRGGYNWDELCDTDIPVPHIDKQRELVKEYNTIVNHINLNSQLIQKLEETAQAIYKQWFVDFEFPDENGQPYKSSGGETKWCEELGKEVPDKWDISTYEVSFSFKTGKLNSDAANKNGQYPFFTCSKETYKTNTFSFDCEALILAGNNANAVYPFKYFKGRFDAYQRTYIITPKNKNLSIYQAYFEILEKLEGFKGSSSGTATKFLTMQILNPIKVLIPSMKTYHAFSKICSPIFSRILLAEKKQEAMYDFINILLYKISAI